MFVCVVLVVRVSVFCSECSACGEGSVFVVNAVLVVRVQCL